VLAQNSLNILSYIRSKALILVFKVYKTPLSSTTINFVTRCLGISYSVKGVGILSGSVEGIYKLDISISNLSIFALVLIGNTFI
jgi:phosphoglycerol transferase MdoB-like AlkP superfamily enzyme